MAQRIMSRMALVTMMSGALLGLQPHQATAADEVRSRPVAIKLLNAWGEVTPIQEDPDGVSAFWSYAKMSQAEKLESLDDESPPSAAFPPARQYCPGIGECSGEPSLPGDYFGYLPAPTPYDANELTRVNGILFFISNNDFSPLPDQPHHCSASVIRSPSKSLVLTAAHCIKIHDKWNGRLLFVPAYNGSLPDLARAPYGKWVVKRVYLPEYISNHDNDIAVLSVYPQQGPDGEVVYLQDAVHGGLVPRTSDIDEAFPLVHVYGYPGNNWNGFGANPVARVGKLFFCLSAGNLDEGGRLQTPNCSTQVGNSGGPSIIVHENSTIEPPEVVATVNNYITNARLLKANFCPIYRAADQDANTIDPDAKCENETSAAGVSHS